jgi:hypothetical protein
VRPTQTDVASAHRVKRPLKGRVHSDGVVSQGAGDGQPVVSARDVWSSSRSTLGSENAFPTPALAPIAGAGSLEARMRAVPVTARIPQDARDRHAFVGQKFRTAGASTGSARSNGPAESRSRPAARVKRLHPSRLQGGAVAFWRNCDINLGERFQASRGTHRPVSRGCENRFRALTDSVGAERRSHQLLTGKRVSAVGAGAAWRASSPPLNAAEAHQSGSHCLAATARTNGQSAPGSACGARCGARPVPPLRHLAHRPELGAGGPDGGWVVTAPERQYPLVSSDCAAGLNSLTTKFLAQYVRRLVLLARSARPRGPPALALWRSGARPQ